MRTTHERFNELLRTIDQIAFQKLDERLVRYLKEKSRVSGSSLINLSHEQIAADLATSRVVISRLLKKLEENKKAPALPQPDKAPQRIVTKVTDPVHCVADICVGKNNNR